MTAVVRDTSIWRTDSQTPTWPLLDHLPSRSRRRLSPLVRMVLHVGHHICSKHQVDDVVFASRFGEIGRQLDITNGLLDTEEVSPSAFSTSVFNTAVALLSLHEGLRGRTRALCAGNATIPGGLLQALTSLDRSTTGRVLFLYGDEETPDLYKPICRDPARPMAVAMLLDRDEQPGLGTVDFQLSSGLRRSQGYDDMTNLFVDTLENQSGQVRTSVYGGILSMKLER